MERTRKIRIISRHQPSSNIIKHLSCEAMLEMSSKNIEKCRRKSKKGAILVIASLVLSCLIFVTVTSLCANLMLCIVSQKDTSNSILTSLYKMSATGYITAGEVY